MSNTIDTQIAADLNATAERFKERGLTSTALLFKQDAWRVENSCEWSEAYLIAEAKREELQYRAFVQNLESNEVKQ